MRQGHGLEPCTEGGFQNSCNKGGEPILPPLLASITFSPIYQYYYSPINYLTIGREYP